MTLRRSGVSVRNTPELLVFRTIFLIFLSVRSRAVTPCRSTTYSRELGCVKMLIRPRPRYLREGASYAAFPIQASAADCELTTRTIVMTRTDNQLVRVQTPDADRLFLRFDKEPLDPCGRALLAKLHLHDCFVDRQQFDLLCQEV